ncbi:MAG: hypothetical protein JSS86_25855 [Cyanobacteria bacterium SZAS LIN-2]|nr:hypothetical protein [Cyanobacteria bacterium SZAS LIN-3]MBS1999782.1 hypothetical protein [Cyanobacteria bacterium SZAS LIN-2]
MKAGESLASIALKHYGDARFAKLITTINRGDIPSRSDGFSTFAFVTPGQVIVLPTYEEANIFSRNFFTKQSQAKFDLAHFARPAMPSDSIPNNILPSQGSRSSKDQAVESRPVDLQPLLPQIQISGLPAEEQAAREAWGTVHAKQPQGAASQFDCQYIVRMPTQTSEEPVIDMAPPTVSVRLQSETPAVDRPEVVALSHYCRMIKFEVEGGQSDTIIKLQVLEESRWQTITAYIITEQTSRRLAHYASKQDRQINIDLPSEVARELSVSDLKRNWKQYVQHYLNAQGKTFSAGDSPAVAAC